MNAYDFDGTIFSGDSTTRFCLFVLGRDAGLLRKLPRVVRAFFLWRRGRATRTQAKQALFESILPRIPDIDRYVREYWEKNEKHIKKWYLAQKRPDDVVISASPEFLLAPVCARLGVALIASVVDPKTGVYTGANCDGSEKVRRFQSVYRETPERFYSDSTHDLPMARLSQSAFRVRGDRITPWDTK